MYFLDLLKIFYLEPLQKLKQKNFILAANLEANSRETINEDTIQIYDEVLPGMLNKTAWFKVRKNFLFYKNDFYKKCCYISVSLFHKQE